MVDPLDVDDQLEVGEVRERQSGLPGGAKEDQGTSEKVSWASEVSDLPQRKFSRGEKGEGGEFSMAPLARDLEEGDLPHRGPLHSFPNREGVGSLVEHLLRQQQEDRVAITQLQRQLAFSVPSPGLKASSPVAPAMATASPRFAVHSYTGASSGCSKPKSAAEDLRTAPSKRTELKGEANVVNHGVCAKAVAAIREAGEHLTRQVDVAEASGILLQGVYDVLFLVL